jgi:hypothetical protein
MRRRAGRLSVDGEFLTLVATRVSCGMTLFHQGIVEYGFVE